MLIMKNKKKSNLLSLKKETISKLANKELEMIAGGGVLDTTYVPSNCGNTCTTNIRRTCPGVTDCCLSIGTYTCGTTK